VQSGIWTEHEDALGRRFFFNMRLQKSVWVHPAMEHMLAVAADSNAAAQALASAAPAVQEAAPASVARCVLWLTGAASRRVAPRGGVGVGVAGAHRDLSLVEWWHAPRTPRIALR
jgi:hypothetical protein